MKKRLPDLAPNAYPPVPPMVGKSITRRRMEMIFNEWAKRYAENPEEFLSILDEDGNPENDYGKHCTEYFYQLADELDAANLLPKA